MGCVHLLAGHPDAALQAFDQAVTKDTCMAVGFFQRGVANFQLDRLQEALPDFRLALAQLRHSPATDYTQLGLPFKLQAWELLFNVAAVQCQLGLWAKATHSLQEANSTGPEGAHNCLDAAWDHVPARGLLVNRSGCTGGSPSRSRPPLQLRQVPRGEVFRPRRQHLEPVDLAKVVASAVPDDQYKGVRPQQSQAQDADETQAPAELAPLWPRDAPDTEKEVFSGQVGQVGHCKPVTYGEQILSMEQIAGQVPPVQCTFILALKAQKGADLSSLRALLSPALAPQAQCGQLSYRDAGDNGHWVPLSGEGALQRAWRDSAAEPEGLRLPCRGVAGRPVLYQVVAQHSYSAQEPEDLALRRGDMVDVLCEVYQAWLEGHLDGHVGIFPKCPVVPASQRV